MVCYAILTNPVISALFGVDPVEGGVSAAGGEDDFAGFVFGLVWCVGSDSGGCCCIGMVDNEVVTEGAGEVVEGCAALASVVFVFVGELNYVRHVVVDYW